MLATEGSVSTMCNNPARITLKYDSINCKLTMCHVKIYCDVINDALTFFWLQFKYQLNSVKIKGYSIQERFIYQPVYGTSKPSNFIYTTYIKLVYDC
jgi:hypothetical protein